MPSSSNNSSYVLEKVCATKHKTNRIIGSIQATLLTFLIGITTYGGCVRSELQAHIAVEEVKDYTTAQTLQEIKDDVEYIRQHLHNEKK